MKLNIVKVAINGTAPLLQHRFVDGVGGKPDPNASDEEIAELVIYKTPDGEVYQPGEHIERSLQKAGVQFKYKGKKTYLDFIKSGVFVRPDVLIHKNQKWEVDKRAVVIQRSRIMRIRPIMNEWELDFELEVINPDIDLKKLNEILVYAGQYIGIGDYRPKYGRFIVTKYKFD